MLTLTWKNYFRRGYKNNVLEKIGRGSSVCSMSNVISSSMIWANVIWHEKIKATAKKCKNSCEKIPTAIFSDILIM